MQRPIQNCKFEFECTKKFEQLEETDSSDVRFCANCERNVYRCNTIKEVQEHAIAGHCISLSMTPCTDGSTAIGDTVLVTSGYFQNHSGMITSLDSEENTADVVINIIGPVKPVTMSMESLVIVSDGEN